GSSSIGRSQLRAWALCTNSWTSDPSAVVCASSQCPSGEGCRGMIKKTLLLAAALLFTTVGVAHAQDAYPPDGGAAITVSDTTPAPGQTITIVARGFQPGTD